MKCALYIRVSTDSQAEEGYSIEEQTERLTAYCTARGWKAAKIYTDAGFTGSNINRPGIEALIRDIKKYDAIVVYKLDRLSRSQKDTLYLIEDVFLASGVDFISISENFDTSTPFGRAMIGILSVFAQLEREQIKERMLMGQLGRAKSGKPLCTVTPPFGYTYKNHALHIDPVQAGIVRDIYTAFLSGKSINKIMLDLNAAGHVGKERNWSRTTVKGVLSKPVYVGAVIYQGKTYEGLHAPIVDPATFDRAQRELGRRQSIPYSKDAAVRPFQARFLLSGLLFCGRCGSPFDVHAGNTRKDGGRAYRYACGGVKRYGLPPCGASRFGMLDLENRVLAEVEKVCLNLDAVTSEAEDTTKEIKALENQLSGVSDSLARLVSLYIRGSIPDDILDAEKAKIEEGKKALEKRIAELKEQTPPLSRAEVSALLERFPDGIKTLDYEEQKIIVRELISRITLDGEMMRIKWRFL